MTTANFMMTSFSGREGSQNLLLWEGSQRKTGSGLVPRLPYHRLGPDLRRAFGGAASAPDWALSSWPTAPRGPGKWGLAIA